MASNAKQTKLIALPVQTVEIPDGVILKRGATEVMITGAGAAEAVKIVLDAAASGGVSVDEIRRLFDRSAVSWVDTLLNNLRSRRLLVPTDSRASPVNGQENHLDIFFWQLGETTERVIERLKKVRVLIIGVNAISKQIALSLAACGHCNFLVFDHPRHRNQHFVAASDWTNRLEWPEALERPQPWKDSQQNDLGDCLIATSDFGGQQALCEWNKLCLKQNVHFLPVLLKNMIGYVGPIAIPGETACYQCLVSRQQSQSVYPNAELRTDDAAYAGQIAVGFHPSMTTMLGAITAFEISRFYGFSVSKQPPGRFLEVNLLAGTMTERTVLKVPRCTACSPLHKISRPNLTKILFPRQTKKMKDMKKIP